MLSVSRTRLATLLILSPLLAPVTAQAECQHSSAVDRCLVGTWKMTTNGALEWMQRNLHQARVTSVSATNNTITFQANGNFATGASHVSVHVAGDRDMVEGTGTMNAQSSGAWAAAGGTLMLCPANTTSSGTAQVHKIEGGTTVNVPMAHIQARATQMAYHCAGDALSTTIPMPRGTTATSTYVRLP